MPIERHDPAYYDQEPYGRAPLRLGARVTWPDDPHDVGVVVVDGQRLAVEWGDGRVDCVAPCGMLDLGYRVERAR